MISVIFAANANERSLTWRDSAENAYTLVQQMVFFISSERGRYEGWNLYEKLAAESDAFIYQDKLQLPLRFEAPRHLLSLRHCLRI